MIRTVLTRALDRAADRLMAALPRTPSGTIALTAIGGAALLAAAIHWSGCWLTGALLLAGVAGGAGYVLTSGWWRRS